MQHRHCAASTYLNPVTRQITGLEMREVENHPIEVLHALPYAVAGCAQASALRRALESGKTVDRSRTTLLYRGSGELLEMDESASLDKSFDGHVLWAVGCGSAA